MFKLMKKLFLFLSILSSCSITFIFLVLHYDHFCPFKCNTELLNVYHGETSEDIFLIRRKIYDHIYNDSANNDKILPEEYPGHDRIPQQMSLRQDKNGRNNYICR